MLLLRKRSRSLLLLLLTLGLLVAACGPSGPSGRATTISVSPGALAFDGTSSATVQVVADGSWTVASNASWLKVTPAAGGTGTTELVVTVDRTGLTPALFGAELAFTGVSRSRTVAVSMRFPTVSGTLSSAGGRITSSALPVAPPSGSPATGDGSEELVPGEYLVVLDGAMASVLEAATAGPIPLTARADLGTYQGMGRSLAADTGVTVLRGVMGTDLPLLVVGTNDPQAVQALLADGRVRSVEPNWAWSVPRLELGPALTPQQAGGYHPDLQWHYDQVNLPAALALTSGEPSTRVAVIDSGFALVHPQLTTNLLPGFDLAEGGANAATYGLCTEHGTHVAGTVGATTFTAGAYTLTGAAPTVTVVPYKVGYVSGTDCLLDGAAILNSVMHAAGSAVTGLPSAPPVSVINLSLGGNTYSQAFKDAIDFALGRGVTVVAAAGNTSPAGLPYVMYPAAYPGVIGVSATNFLEGRAYYSHYGPEIDVAAPGGDMRYDLNGDLFSDGVFSTYWDVGASQPDWVVSQGTSMASPHVAAIAALMKSANPALSPAELTQLLQQSARDIGAAGFDNEFGWGLVDAGAAVAAAYGANSATFAQFTARLLEGSTVVASVPVSASASFDLGQVPAGTYTLEAGTDRDGDGQLGDFAEFYGALTVEVSYTGDVVRQLEMELR